MRKKKPEELEREEAVASRRKSGTPTYIPPSPHSGPLNSEALNALGITLPELISGRGNSCRKIWRGAVLFRSLWSGQSVQDARPDRYAARPSGR